MNMGVAQSGDDGRTGHLLDIGKRRSTPWWRLDSYRVHEYAEEVSAADGTVN